MPPLQRYLQDLLHGYGHYEKEKQVSIVVDRALSSQRRSKAIKSAHENMTSLFQEMDQSKSISDKSIACHTPLTESTASARCRCIEQQTALPTSRPRSLPIPINCKCQDSSNDVPSNTEQMMVQYDLSTWRMYNRIVHHRRRRSTVPPCACPNKGTKVCREHCLSNVSNNYWSNRSIIPPPLGSKTRTRDYLMPVVAKDIISEEDFTYDHEITTIFELDEDL